MPDSIPKSLQEIAEKHGWDKLSPTELMELTEVLTIYSMTRLLIEAQKQQELREKKQEN